MNTPEIQINGKRGQVNEQRLQENDCGAKENGQRVQTKKRGVQGYEQIIQENEEAIRENEQGVQANDHGVQPNEQGIQENEQEGQKSEQDIQANEQGTQAVIVDQRVQENEQVGQQSERNVQVNEQGIQTDIVDQRVQENEQGVQTEEDELEQGTDCVFCLESPRFNDVKLCPCNYSIHQECFKMIYFSYEKMLGKEITAVKCLYCNADVKLKVKPEKGLLVKGLGNLSHRYKWLSVKLFNCVTIIMIQQALTIYGLIFLTEVYGKQYDDSMTSTYDLVVTTGLCQSIPLYSMAVSFSGWEEHLLLFLRRCSRLPVVGPVFPREYPEVREPPRCPKGAWLHAVIDGLILPFFAVATGHLVCGSGEQGLRRLLVGAAAFLSLRGALYMYYRQAKYGLQASRTVADYQHLGRQ